MTDINQHRDIERAFTLLSVVESFNCDIARLKKLRQSFINQIKDVGDERIKHYLSERLKSLDKDSALHDT